LLPTPLEEEGLGGGGNSRGSALEQDVKTEIAKNDRMGKNNLIKISYSPLVFTLPSPWEHRA
jgi:hypothetical protein